MSPPILRSSRGAAAGTWVRRAGVEERLFAAEIVVLAYSCDEGDLIRLAASIDVEPEWGETHEGLRERTLWRGRYFYRVRPPEEQMPPVVLRWWARLIQELPLSWRPFCRSVVDKIRRGER